MTDIDTREMMVIEQDTEDFVHSSQRLEVVNQESLDRGVFITQQIKSFLSEIDDTFDPHISSAYQAHKKLLETKRKFTGPLEEAESLIKSKIGVFKTDNPEAQAKGLSCRENVSLIVEDIEKLIKAVSSGKVPADVLKADTSKIKKLVDAGFKVPGVVVTRSPVISIRK
jgi:hypothetical protein